MWMDKQPLKHQYNRILFNDQKNWAIKTQKDLVILNEYC